jgi:diguanylate cyclase (GGDEF)-like protein
MGIKAKQTIKAKQDAQKALVETANKLTNETEQRCEAQMELNKLQQQTNAELEKKISDRTQELESLNDKLRHLSNTDALTQINNRMYFEEAAKQELKRCIRSSTQLCVALIDVDHFKQINDTLGHDVGDDCLVHLSGLIKNRFKRSSDLIARYGGEEFIIMMSNMEEDKADESLDAFVKEVEKNNIVSGGNDIKLTISMGYIYVEPTPETDLKTLVKKADICLYKAKENGRNRSIKHRGLH